MENRGGTRRTEKDKTWGENQAENGSTEFLLEKKKIWILFKCHQKKTDWTFIHINKTINIKIKSVSRKIIYEGEQKTLKH